MDAATIDTPVLDTPVIEAPESVSIADHAAQYGPQADPAPVEEPIPANETAQQKVEREQRRDQANGQYRPGFKRHRAKSQQASAEDAPRIRELTAARRQAEERATALEARLAALEQQRTTPAAPAQTPPPPQPQARQTTPENAEPVDTDPKYEGNYGAFLTDHARWAARDEYRRAREAEQQQAQTQQRLGTFVQRLDATKAKYQDFERVAFAPVPWNEQSAIHEFILDDDNGPDVLYHLQSHPQERDEILRMPPIKQVSRLTLLSQRFSSPTSEAAGSNGAAPVTKPVILPPKPPTPLRTEAQRATPALPATDGSLSIADHAKAFGPKRR
jgi:hypothetical protein